MKKLINREIFFSTRRKLLRSAATGIPACGPGVENPVANSVDEKKLTALDENDRFDIGDRAAEILLKKFTNHE